MRVLWDEAANTGQVPGLEKIVAVIRSRDVYKRQLLASDVTPFAFWYEGDPEGGCIRFLTETESERLMGLPEGWTKYGADGVEIRPLQRYKALGLSLIHISSING